MELPLHLKLVDDINCADDCGPERMVDTGNSRVIESSLGRYREAGEERYSRIAYRFRVGTLGRPHMLVVSYPDDRERTMDIHVSTPPRAAEQRQNMSAPAAAPHQVRPVHVQTGVCTGGEYPVTNRVQEHTCFFWPEETEHAVLLMTWATGRPAAAQRIQVYEVEGDLPRLKVTAPEGLPGRELGLCWEDASVITLLGATEATPETWRRTVERLADYMGFIGCEVMTYPVCIYDGPYYGSAIEQTDGLNAYRLSVHPGDWVGSLLEVFERKGLRFVASLTLASLPSLKVLAQGDEKRLAAGENIISQVLADGAVASEKDINSAGPQFDPTHPEVQKRLLAVAEEIVRRFGDSPAFAGVAVNIWGASIGWFGTLEAGYGDHPVSLFERDTGIRVPVERTDPDRFRKRHDWLLASARDAWTDWRCRRIADLILRMNGILQAKRSDLRLVLSLFIPYGLTSVCPFDLSRWDAGKVSVYQMHREGGIDTNLLRGVPGIVLDKILQPDDYRLRTCSLYGEDRPWTPEYLESRDLDFDPENLEHVGLGGSAWLYNRYFESTPEGRAKVSPDLLAGHAKLEAAQWWNLLPGWTYGAVTPGHHNFMEWYELAAAGLDALCINNGGLTIGTMGHEQRVRRFASAFRALPALEFRALEGATDPVMVRYRQVDGALYCCVVNQEPVAAAVELNLVAERGTPVLDLGEDKIVRVPASGRWVVKLQPFGFRSFRIGSGSARLAGARARLPRDWTAALREKVLALRQAHRTRVQSGAAQPGDEQFVRECRLALLQGRWTRVRHLVESRRAAEITGLRPF